MRAQAVTIEGITSQALSEAIFNKMDSYPNVEREHFETISYYTEYFTITLAEKTFRVMIQTNGSSWIYVCPCNSTDTGGTYRQRYKLTIPGTYSGSQNAPNAKGFTRMRWFSDDNGAFGGFSVPYYNGNTSPPWWMLTVNEEGLSIFIESETTNVWVMDEEPYSAGLIVTGFDLFHESNETVYIEQVLYTAGEGGAIPELWYLENNVFYNSSQIISSFMYVGTEDGYYMRLRDHVWAKISMVDPDERIIIQ